MLNCLIRKLGIETCAALIYLSIADALKPIAFMRLDTFREEFSLIASV